MVKALFNKVEFNKLVLKGFETLLITPKVKLPCSKVGLMIPTNTY